MPGGHGQRAHALGTEGIGGESQGQCRVDAAGRADDDPVKAGLVDVVAEPENDLPILEVHIDLFG